MNILDSYYHSSCNCNNDLNLNIDCPQDNLVWNESEIYRVKKIDDHKSVSYFFIENGSDITRQEICDCQKDIFALINNKTKTISSIILGKRVQETDTIHYVVKDPETIYRTYFFITCFESNMMDEPSFDYLVLLLVEFLADKKYCMTKYKLTGKETSNMLDAMEAVGFKKDNDYYTYMPITSKYISRF